MSGLYEQHLLLSDTHDIFDFFGDQEWEPPVNNNTFHGKFDMIIVDKCCLDRVTIPGLNFAE